MKYLWRTAGYTFLENKRNEEILEEFLASFLEENLCTYRHVHRMEDYRLPKQF
jgi:hypothetical protein